MSTHNKKKDLFDIIDKKGKGLEVQKSQARSKSYISYRRVGVAPMVDIDIMPTRRIRLTGIYGEGYDSGPPVVPMTVAGNFQQINPASNFDASSLQITGVIGVPIADLVFMFGISQGMFKLDLILEVGCLYKLQMSSFIAGAGSVVALLELEELEA